MSGNAEFPKVLPGQSWESSYQEVTKNGVTMFTNRDLFNYDLSFSFTRAGAAYYALDLYEYFCQWEEWHERGVTLSADEKIAMEGCARKAAKLMSYAMGGKNDDI